jgi:hypothetical protein
MTWPSVDHQHGRLHGPGAEPVQGLLAGLGYSDFSHSIGNGTESKPTRMAFARGCVPEDMPRHVRLADLLFVPGLQVSPCLVQDHARELDGLPIVCAPDRHGRPTVALFCGAV